MSPQDCLPFAFWHLKKDVIFRWHSNLLISSVCLSQTERQQLNVVHLKNIEEYKAQLVQEKMERTLNKVEQLKELRKAVRDERQKLQKLELIEKVLVPVYWMMMLSFCPSESLDADIEN